MQPLLSDLCSICHKNPPKYRCPACSTRTCSLDCVQKHKSWGCSGKRDPTVYVKKAQLATPSGVDHDFNFISGIEQSRDRAEEHLQGRSIQDAESRSTRLNQPSFRNRLQSAHVNIEYAPLGMTRQKLNKTRLTQSKRINWTVEWLHADSTSTIGSIFDDEQVHKAYLPLYLKSIGATPRKRKRNDGPAISGNVNSIQDTTTPLSETPTSSTKDIGEASSLKRDHEGVVDKEPLTTNADIDDSQSTAPAAHLTTTDSQSHYQDNAAIGEDALQGSVAFRDEPNSEQPPLPLKTSGEDYRLHYYLLKPRTSGTEKVLVPISPTDTFLTCLQNQTVLEFPTIQVLTANADALPAGYITEDEYQARYNQEARELQQLLEEEGEVEASEDIEISRPDVASSDADTGPVPNTSALLATLERDMQRK